MVEYLSVSDVESLGQLGKVFVDVNCLQPPAVSSQTFVKRNSVALKDIKHTKIKKRADKTKWQLCN